jgi:hypothetical protein
VTPDDTPPAAEESNHLAATCRLCTERTLTGRLDAGGEWRREGTPVTEAEWLTCKDPVRMVKFLRCKASERKRRLLAVACCRRIWGLLTLEPSRAAVEVAERFADGEADEADRSRAAEAATAILPPAGVTREQYLESLEHRLSHRTPEGQAASAAIAVLSPAAAFAARRVAQSEVGGPEEKAARCDLIRCIFDYPGAPRTIAPQWLAWNGGTLPKFARAIYDAQAFDCLPLLADALEDASCADAELLGHLRGPGPHCRGCWAVDRLLGKS